MFFPSPYSCKIYTDNGYTFFEQSVNQMIGKLWMFCKIYLSSITFFLNKACIETNKHIRLHFIKQDILNINISALNSGNIKDDTFTLCVL